MHCRLLYDSELPSLVLMANVQLTVNCLEGDFCQGRCEIVEFPMLHIKIMF